MTGGMKVRKDATVYGVGALFRILSVLVVAVAVVVVAGTGVSAAVRCAVPFVCCGVSDRVCGADSIRFAGPNLIRDRCGYQTATVTYRLDNDGDGAELDPSFRVTRVSLYFDESLHLSSAGDPNSSIPLRELYRSGAATAMVGVPLSDVFSRVCCTPCVVSEDSNSAPFEAVSGDSFVTTLPLSSPVIHDALRLFQSQAGDARHWSLWPVLSSLLHRQNTTLASSTTGAAGSAPVTAERLLRIPNSHELALLVVTRITPSDAELTTISADEPAAKPIECGLWFREPNAIVNHFGQSIDTRSAGGDDSANDDRTGDATAWADTNSGALRIPCQHERSLSRLHLIHLPPTEETAPSARVDDSASKRPRDPEYERLASESFLPRHKSKQFAGYKPSDTVPHADLVPHFFDEPNPELYRGMRYHLWILSRTAAVRTAAAEQNLLLAREQAEAAMRESEAAAANVRAGANVDSFAFDADTDPTVLLETGGAEEDESESGSIDHTSPFACGTPIQRPRQAAPPSMESPFDAFGLGDFAAAMLHSKTEDEERLDTATDENDESADEASVLLETETSDGPSAVPHPTKFSEADGPLGVDEFPLDSAGHADGLDWATRDDGSSPEKHPDVEKYEGRMKADGTIKPQTGSSFPAKVDTVGVMAMGSPDQNARIGAAL